MSDQPPSSDRDQPTESIHEGPQPSSGASDSPRRLIEDALREAGDCGRDSAPPIQQVQIEGYEIVREIHRGGQGVVYQAIQKSTKSKVAIKLLLHGTHASKAARIRFDREIEIVAQLKHPNIITIFDSGETVDGCHYYVMDYIRGSRLDEYVRDKRLTLDEALKTFLNVCHAVQYAHRHGIIHRDLKPSNILVDDEGNPKVLDFGLAKLMFEPIETIVSMTQDMVGTLPYMAPEQARGSQAEIDTRTDIYALGVILYELLTGHYPYPVIGNVMEVLRHITESEPAPLTRIWKSGSGVSGKSSKSVRSAHCPIDDEVQTIVLKALAKQSDRRYQSASEFSRDIERYLLGEPIVAKGDSGWYLLRKKLGRHGRKIATTLVAFAAVISVVMFVYNRQTSRAQREISRAQRAYQFVLEGHKHQELGHFDKALQAYHNALAIEPDQYKAWGNICRLKTDIYLNSESADDSLLEESIEAARRSLAINPDRAGPWNNMAVPLLILGRDKDAQKACEEALIVDPDFYWAMSNLAKILTVQNEGDKALRVAKKAVDVATKTGDRDNYWAADAWCTLATIQIWLGRGDPLNSLKNADACHRGDAWASALRARLYLDVDVHRDVEQALAFAYVADAVVTTPDGRFKRVLAHAMLRNRKWSNAVRYADQAMELGDIKPPNEFIAAMAESRAGNHRRAQERFDRGKAALTKIVVDDKPIVDAQRDMLWIDTASELLRLRDEAASLLGK